MKTQTTSLPWPVAPAAVTAAPVSVRKPLALVAPTASTDGLPAAVRWVGLLAVGQMVLFAVIFLFLCAVGYANPPAASLELRLSEYAPKTQRDPFGVELAPAPADGAVLTATPVPVELQLKGILYHATRPAALVNDKVVELNKPVAVKTAHGDVSVRALEITREIVLLEVGGQKLELRLGAANRATASE
jgi:hypothetical protein